MTWSLLARDTDGRFGFAIASLARHVDSAAELQFERIEVLIAACRPSAPGRR